MVVIPLRMATKDNRITVRVNGKDHIPPILNLLRDTEFTERELEIFRIIISLNKRTITPDIRRHIKDQLDVSRENLNNMLIRMKGKGIFDDEWNVNKLYHPLFGKVEEILIKLN